MPISSQSDKGELVIGAGTDAYTSYSADAAAAHRHHTLEAICELFPTFRRLRMLRNWGGIVDVTPDRSPIIGKTPVPGLFVNCGWGTGGFKATPGSGHVFAHTIATRRAASDRAPFTLDRFRDRPPDRRGRRRRGGALTASASHMLLIPAPVRRARPETRIPPTAARPMIARPAPTRARQRRRMGGLSLLPQQSERPARGALAACPWLRPLLQLRARHGQRQDPDDLSAPASHGRI